MAQPVEPIEEKSCWKWLVTYDGAHIAEGALSNLRTTRDDEWLSEVSVIEHDKDGRYSMKAKNPDVDKVTWVRAWPPAD